MAEDFRAALVSLLPRLRRFGLALTGSPTDADELVQDTYQRAIERIDQLRDGARLDAWLYGIMRHRWFDELRSRRLRSHEPIEAADREAAQGGEGVVHARMRLAAVRDALGKLSPEQRTVLVLVCVDGLSYREAADVLGIPMGTVMSRLSRGRRELHALLEGMSSGERSNVLPMSPRTHPNCA